MVIGCSHILVFMAGQKSSGFALSHARATHVTILSHMPLAILPKVLASNGAITNISAHFTRSICNTGSPRSCQAAHSTVSDSTWISDGSWASFRKCLALSVTTTLTSRLFRRSISTSCGSLIVATLPVQPTNTFFLEILAIFSPSVTLIAISICAININILYSIYDILGHLGCNGIQLLTS